MTYFYTPAIHFKNCFSTFCLLLAHLAERLATWEAHRAERDVVLRSPNSHRRLTTFHINSQFLKLPQKNSVCSNSACSKYQIYGPQIWPTKLTTCMIQVVDLISERHYVLCKTSVRIARKITLHPILTVLLRYVLLALMHDLTSI